ncbi:pantetheine-phosphate adenylyltransferase [Skermania piniformis]|uniref:Phosphopantetheine adenylyltransferase n=1 Tax=Skermania pinensis TaxID=39122 RepID=A0ABX8S6S6_9ACTN|nr:pantetheine-phosphate adenylyltransferase [Skermania piniformis]QXQ12722.1 pantetheine-phosphate adenylyltransferase [Skermania piniformis]
MTGVLCPGSYDPVHNGHLDVITRAAAMFDEVVVTVMVNPNKQGMFTVAERMELLRAVTADLPGVRVDSWAGLLVDFARTHGLVAIVKGLRGAADFDYELQMAQMNRKIGGVDTLYLATGVGTGYLSSSLLKEVAAFGGDVADLLPAVVHERLQQRLAERRA